MSADTHNPPLPGDGIDAKPVEPPFNRAARGEADPKPDVLHHNLTLTPRVMALTPDGRAIVPGRLEEKRQAAIEARDRSIQPGIERDGAQGPDQSKLQRDFADARDHRR